MKLLKNTVIFVNTVNNRINARTDKERKRKSRT